MEGNKVIEYWNTTVLYDLCKMQFFNTSLPRLFIIQSQILHKKQKVYFSIKNDKNKNAEPNNNKES